MPRPSTMAADASGQYHAYLCDSRKDNPIMAVARSRVWDLLKVSFLCLEIVISVTDISKVQARIYGHTFNPACTRTGNKVLRERLKGPAVASYYPPRSATLKEMMAFYPQLETYDEKEADRIDSIAIIKARGKGPPKKKRTAEGIFIVSLIPELFKDSVDALLTYACRIEEVCKEEVRCAAEADGFIMSPIACSAGSCGALCYYKRISRGVCKLLPACFWCDYYEPFDIIMTNISFTAVTIQESITFSG